MRPLRTVLIFIGVVLLLGALLAPWLFWVAQSTGHFWSWLARQPFHRFVSRSLLFVAIIGLWPLTRRLQIRSWNDLGLRSSNESKRQFAQGLLFGFITLAIVALTALLFGARRWNSELSLATLGGKILSAMATAVVVAVIEETLFRGTLFGGIRRQHHWITALLLSSAIYAWVHFFRRPASPDVVTWTSGFHVLGQMLRGFVEIRSLVPGFFVLLLAGMILAMAYQRTNALWFSIGTHAGWIFWLKIYGAITTEMPTAHHSFWGSSKLTDGWAAAIILLIAAVLNWDFHQMPKYNVKPV
jgi:uncharacterized protein